MLAKNKVTSIIISAFLLFLTLLKSYANDNMMDFYKVRIKGIDYTLTQCLDPKQVKFTTSNSISCIGIATNSLDAIMNDIWSSLKKEISSKKGRYCKGCDPFQLLLDAQRKWLAYRKVKCEHYYTNQGTIYNQIESMCYYKETLQRTKELNSLLFVYK